MDLEECARRVMARLQEAGAQIASDAEAIPRVAISALTVVLPDGRADGFEWITSRPADYATRLIALAARLGID